MKKMIMFFTYLLLFACKGSVVDLPIAQEVNLTMTVSNDIVNPGDTITVYWITENVDQLTSNFGAKIGPQNLIAGSSLLVVNSKTTISMTAVGGGKILTKSQTIDIRPFVIPTAKDTIASGYWTLTQSFLSIDNQVTWNEESFPDANKNMRFYFYENGTEEIYAYPYAKDNLIGNGEWDIQGRYFVQKDPQGDKFYPFVLTQKQLILYVAGKYVDVKTGKEIPVVHKQIYTR